jgi:hypothetical protein
MEIVVLVSAEVGQIADSANSYEMITSMGCNF